MIMENTPLLETERLILRKFTREDIDALFAIFSDEEVNTFLPCFPLKSVEEAEIYYQEKYADAYKKPCGYQYAICLRKDNISIGYINVGMEKLPCVRWRIAVCVNEFAREKKLYPRIAF